MLEILRRYQRYVFFVVIASFSFFGVYSTFDRQEVREDVVMGTTAAGEPILASQMQALGRFLAKDREDGGEGPPNFCNDGVIRYDFLRTRLADLIVTQYFASFQEDFAARLERAKRFQLYAHPKNSAIGVESLWNQFVPGMTQAFHKLQEIERVSPAVFEQLSRLYAQQGFLRPEMLRQFLSYQEQLQGLEKDPRLARQDLSLFGFHSAADWFGPQFVERVSRFVLEAASAASSKGVRVSLEEAKGDLMHNFQESMERSKEKISYADQLRLLGLDERTAAEMWQKVLLFRRYFQDVGYATFVDRLPYQKFAHFALEDHLVDEYRFPFALSTLNDLYQFQMYLKGVSPAPLWPTSFFSLEEVEKKSPELVQTPYKLKVAWVTKTQAGLRIPLKEVWEWQLENWSKVAREFPPLSEQVVLREDRFAALHQLEPAVRTRLDAWSRQQIVGHTPSWIDAAIEVAPKQELEAGVSAEYVYLTGGVRLPSKEFFEGVRIGSGNAFYRLEDAEKVGEKHVISFEQARSVFSVPKEEVVRSTLKEVFKAIGSADQDDSHYITHRFAAAAKSAWEALQDNPEDPQWIAGNDCEPFLAQWKLQCTEKHVQRTSQDKWMKEHALMMIPNQWSPIQIPSVGAISFFYLKGKTPIQEPVLEQMNFGYEILAADAERVLAEHLLQQIHKNDESDR